MRRGAPRPSRPPFLTMIPLLALGLTAAVAAPGPDADGDGYADCSVAGCDAAGLTCGDCDDTRAAVHPGASEACNHRDDDCDGGVDEVFPRLTARRLLTDRHPAANDHYGIAAASIGDANGDGVPDFVVGNPADDLGAIDGGSATLYSGADRSWLCRATGVAYDQLGTGVAATGDVNGDGVPDFAASAPQHDAVVVLSGADCSQIARCVDGASGVANLGGDHGLAGFVDVTGDGIPEILAGADHSNTVLHYGGRAVVFTVSASGGCTVLRALDDPDLAIYAYLGYAITGIADVTGDGVADIAVGESGYASYRGSVLIFSGADGTLVRRILDPSGAANDHLGESLAAIQCLDGDGRPELAVSSPRDATAGGSNAGHVFIFSPEDGAIVRDIVHADGGSDWLGWSLAVLSDVNGDGVQDIAAGARYADTARGADAGKGVIFSGADGTEITELEDGEGAAGDQLGYAVAAAGDLTGDGIPEVLVGAPFADAPAGADAGRVSIVSFEADCDGDGEGPFGGDCDDADASVWSPPGETRDLAFDPDRRTLRWAAPLDGGNSGAPLAYDVLRADAPGGFASSACVASGILDLQAQDPARPSAAQGFYYLSRAQNACGDGTLGTDGAGAPRTGAACP